MAYKYWLKSRIIINSLASNLAVALLVVLGVTPSNKPFLWLEPEQVAYTKQMIQLFMPVILAYLNGSTVLERLNPTIKRLWSEDFVPGANKPVPPQ